MRQAIFWTNNDLVNWRMYSLSGLDELINLWQMNTEIQTNTGQCWAAVVTAHLRDLNHKHKDTRTAFIDDMSHKICTWFVVATWWRHQMEAFSALMAICAGNSPVPVNSPHKGQWRGAIMFSLICIWINGWVNNRAAGDLRRYRAHYDVSVMTSPCFVDPCDKFTNILQCCFTGTRAI